MSHHLDSPVARQDTRLDITDIYAFRGEVGTVLIMNLNSSILGEAAAKGFHPEARYEFRLDLDGDAIEDLVFRVTFGPRDGDGAQPVEVRRLTGQDARRGDEGIPIATGATEQAIEGAGGIKVWAGPASEPFFIEPTVLQAVGGAFKNGTAVDLSDWSPADAVNLFANTTIHSIVLEIPDAFFDGLLGADRRIGIWGMTILATDAGGWRSINRAGQPMMQPIFNPADSDRSSEYNTTPPAEDRVRYGALFAGLVASVVAAHGTTEDPAAYGAAVADLLLPDILPYRIGSAASYGFAGRNGRTLTDNAPNVMFSLVTNSAFTTGLTRRSVSAAPRERFPYLAAPVSSAAVAPIA